MTTSLDLLTLVYESILGPDAGAMPPVYATSAAHLVFKPGDWPTQDGQYPNVKLRLVGEDRQSIARSGPPEFTTNATIRISGEVSAPAKLDDAGATDAEVALWTLKRQIEVAVINSYPLSMVIQQIASIRAQLAFNSDAATHLAGIQMDLVLEFYEGPEDFAPVSADDLDRVDLSLTDHLPTGFTLDLPQ